MNKEEIKKLLFTQIEGLMDANNSGKPDQVEYIFEGIKSYILKGENDFIAGIVKDEKEYNKELELLKDNAVKQTEEALKGKNNDDIINDIEVMRNTLRNDYQALMQKYLNDRILSAVTYYDRL